MGMTYLLRVGVEPDLKLCITLVRVGFPLSAAVSFTSTLEVLVAALSLFFCRDRLIAARAASLRGFPLGVRRDVVVVGVELEDVAAGVDFVRLFLSENRGNEEGTVGFGTCGGIEDVDGAEQRWSFGCRCVGQNSCLQDYASSDDKLLVVSRSKTSRTHVAFHLDHQYLCAVLLPADLSLFFTCLQLSDLVSACPCALTLVLDMPVHHDIRVCPGVR